MKQKNDLLPKWLNFLESKLIFNHKSLILNDKCNSQYFKQKFSMKQLTLNKKDIFHKFFGFISVC